MTDPFSLSIFAAWPDPATGDALPGLAAIVAWLVSHLTAAALAVLGWLPSMWMRIAASVTVIAIALLWLRWLNRPAKLGRPPRRRLLRPVDQRGRDGER